MNMKHESKKIVRLVSVLLVLSCLVVGCGSTPKYLADEVTLSVSSVASSYKIVFVNDLHMQIANNEIAEESVEFINARVTEFAENGVTTEARWENLPDYLNKSGADLVIFGGDMVDFCSEANTLALKAGFEKLKMPYMYLRSDHDTFPYWLSNQDNAYAKSLQDNVCDNSDVQIYDLGEVLVVGINNSCNNITEAGLTKIEEAFSLDKPVVLATHIPFAQCDKTELQEFSETNRGRRLYWGRDAEKYPGECTAELMNMIYSGDSPVIAVLGAHLHYRWEGDMCQGTIEHIFAPCYTGNIGIVNIN